MAGTICKKEGPGRVFREEAAARVCDITELRRAAGEAERMQKIRALVNEIRTASHFAHYNRHQKAGVVERDLAKIEAETPWGNDLSRQIRERYGPQLGLTPVEQGQIEFSELILRIIESPSVIL